MLARFDRVVSALVTVTLLFSAPIASVFAAEGRQIEEVVVTAEKRESSVQDTAISITAFTGEFIEDFGLRNQEDLQNYIPATTIQPYDLSVRGIGRLYRALGGDPGVATYFDGAYSEDFGIASTEGGLFDLERIEVLRGPQGTLYGRNGIGGAVNFISKRPSDEFEGEIKTIFGAYETKEVYGMLSGPIIDGLVNARFTGIKRSRDGFIEELGDGTDTQGNPVSTGRNRDLNNYGDENYALALEFTPSDTLNILVRANERSYRRNMSGAVGAGSLIVSEMGGIPDPVTGGERWTSTPQFGWRRTHNPADAGATTCVDATSRFTQESGGTVFDAMCIVPTGLVPYINGTAGGSIQGTGVYEFNHNGIQRFGQPIVAGVDPFGDTSAWQNYAYGSNPGQVARFNRATKGSGSEIPDLDGDDLEVWTNGYNDEFFDHQAAYLTVAWDIAENLTIKYVGGYTDYFYDRTTEDDRGGTEHDLQFYAAQENDNFQHEIQIFWDINEDINITAGLFMYENNIDQQLDFYYTDSWSKYTDDRTDVMYAGPFNNIGLLSLDFLSGYSGGQMNHRTAQEVYMGRGPEAGQSTAGLNGGFANLYDGTTAGLNAADDPNTEFDESYGGVVTASRTILGPWYGDNLGTAGRVDHGPVSDGTTFIWDTENRTSAKAVYIQGEWQIDDTWALTLGARWAEDKKEVEENLYVYTEVLAFLGMAEDDPSTPEDERAASYGNLYAYNAFFTGGLNADGTVNDFDSLYTRGQGIAAGIYRAMEETYDDITWRINVDYTPTEDDLVYFSITTGYRAGGFNLGFNSPTPVYDKETVTAYEIGYKGQMFDGTMQVNASAYLYDYEGIALQFQESGGIFGEGTSVTNGPDVQTIGFETDVLWLATDNITLGFNYSYTEATYQDGAGDKLIIDNTNPLAPEGIYTPEERSIDIDGESVPRIPKHKWTVWAEYAQSLGDNGKILYMTSLNYTDEFIAFATPRVESPLTVLPDYYRWDARVTWNSATEQWGVSAFVNNITNDVGIRQVNVENAAQNYRYSVEPTNPRMWGVEVQYKFGAF
jgi:outer membrane receptor protein involved in Fe transport